MNRETTRHSSLWKNPVWISAAWMLSLVVMGFFLYLSLSTAQEEGAPPYLEVFQGESRVRIDSWYDEQAERLYFFLPSFTLSQKGQTRLHIPRNGELTLGDTILRNGDGMPEISPQAEGVLRYPDQEGLDKSQRVVFMVSSPLPALFIETASGSLDRIHADKTEQEKGAMLMMKADGTVDYEGALTFIKGRGGASLRYLKRNYTLRLPAITSLLDMGAGRTWVLCANALDTSGLKNHIVYDTARKAGVPYAVEDAFVDLFINHEYRGLYQLMEKIEVGESRVDIRDLGAATQAVNSFDLSVYPTLNPKGRMYSDIPEDPADITGGYLMEMDDPNRYAVEASGFVSGHNKHVVIKYPKYSSGKQVEYIAEVVNKAEEAIFTPDGIHPDTGKSFAEYIDLASWVKRYLIDELFMNIDADATSSYLFKDAGDERLYAGPVWDYDISIHTKPAPTLDWQWLQLSNPEAFYAPGEAVSCNEWYQHLYRIPDFYEALVREYREVFVPLAQEWLGGKMEEAWRRIRLSTNMSNLRWKELGMLLEEEGQLQEIKDIEHFLTRRMEFLDRVWIRKEPYYAVQIKLPNSVLDLCVWPGETLQDQIARNAPGLQGRSFFRDGEHTLAFDPNTVIAENMTLYLGREAGTQPAEPVRHAVYVAFWNGGGEGFYVEDGQSLWEGALKGQAFWRTAQFCSDPYHTIPFDVHAPITESLTIYLKPSNQNIMLLGVVGLLGAALLAVEIHKNDRTRRKGGKLG